MRTREAVGHAVEVAGQDLEAIRENHTELRHGARHMPHVLDEIDYLRFIDLEYFRLRRWSPRPGALLLNSAFKDMGSQEAKPATSKLAFASDTLVPLAGISPQVATHEGRWGSDYAEACFVTERYFLEARQQVREVRKMNQNQVSAYLDDSGNPVLFRKSSIESTAINLMPIALDEGAVLPAGTILAVPRSKSHKMNRQQTGEYTESSFKLATYALPQVLEITPVRLSPWAYDDPADRAIFGLSGRLGYVKADCSRRRENFFEHTTLDDYSQAAQRIVELCAE